MNLFRGVLTLTLCIFVTHTFLHADNWSLIQKLQEASLAETDRVKKAAFDEQLAQALNALGTQTSSVRESEVKREPLLAPVLQITESAQNTKVLEIIQNLEARYKKLEQEITDITTVYCSRKLLVFKDKIYHDRVTHFLTSWLTEIRLYLDTAKGAFISDQQQIINYVHEKIRSMSFFVEIFYDAQAMIITAFVVLHKDDQTWSFVHNLMLDVLIKIMNLEDVDWLEDSHDAIIKKSIKRGHDIAYDVLSPHYQTSIFKRLWSKSSLDRLLSTAWSDRWFPKHYAKVMALYLIAQQEHDWQALENERVTIAMLISDIEGMSRPSINSCIEYDQVVNALAINLFELKAHVADATALKFDYSSNPDKAESYCAHMQLIKEPLFKTLYQRSSFKSCMTKYMTALDLYFKSETSTVEVMYEIYSALYCLEQLKNRAAHGLLKKMVYGVKDYHLLLEQMLEILQKVYINARAALIQPQPGFMHKLMSGEWFTQEKIKSFAYEKSGKVVVELAHKCLGQKFDTKESAMVYIISIAAPLLLLAALKYFVPNLPQRVQQKVIDFIRVMPEAQSDDQKLAQLIRDNPEVVQTFLKQDPQLASSLIAQIDQHKT